MSAAQRVSGVDNSPASKRKMVAGNQSLNHLLNFSLPPRQTHIPPPRRSRRTGTQQGIWNKEKFVNAQYRFVMNPNGDYTVHFADPDIYYQWQDILQVIVPRSSALSIAGSSADVSRDLATEGHACPICLSPPAAPRMTKCGHIFCFPCILHYLGTSETTKWARCPICFDSVASHQLRSVHWYDEPTAPEQGLLQMRLMERPQITTLALPRSPTWPSDALPPHQAPFHFMPDVFAFSKFMIATPDYMINELSRELDELATERRTLERLGDTLGVTFVDAAEEKVRRQLAKANALDIGPIQEAELRARQEADAISERARRRAEYEAQRREPSTNGVVEEVPDALLSTTARAPRVRKNVNPPPPSSSTYFFYQAASGAPIFLHPLDIRVLLARFGSYAAFPDAITVRVEAAQEGTVDDALRKRCKYLGHVPEAADVVFVEADLRAVVGDDALAPFEAALRMRRARRKDKDKKDDKARAKAEERERAKLGIVHAAPPAPPHPVEVWEAVPDDLFAPQQEPPRDAVDEQHDEEPEPARGAWGSRSFAAALHTSREHASEDAHEDHAEDFDNAWADFEVQARGGGGGGGGRRGVNKKSKLVIIGGGGGGARRRR
ncbi:hypothetical protein AURDEDRAFT_117371 [Auricularia subglabra TFB-10046 SS5]|uniref:RING-type domain-containing protein n=1 Tax=Auricularia subglabra (strain TFB-10046 / SS5) TaxID=717982 RepID=J0CXJ2_AURST|nr:hypothetical protein AURDEDRAFT_117371 [Auricularia subglabra TFB-10046 SS5]